MEGYDFMACMDPYEPTEDELIEEGVTAAMEGDIEHALWIINELRRFDL